MTSAERRKLSNAKWRIRQGRAKPEDPKNYEELHPKAERIGACRVSASVRSRISAFSEYFDKDYLSDLKPNTE